MAVVIVPAVAVVAVVLLVLEQMPHLLTLADLVATVQHILLVDHLLHMLVAVVVVMRMMLDHRSRLADLVAVDRVKTALDQVSKEPMDLVLEEVAEPIGHQTPQKLQVDLVVMAF